MMIPTAVYGSETWSLGAQVRRKIEVFEVMCLRSIRGIKRVDKVRNFLIREARVGVEYIGKNGKERAEMVRAFEKNR